MHSYDEKRVLELLALGSEEAFVQLYDRYRPFIYNVSLKLIRDQEQAKEILQEVFMDLWRRREVVSQAANVKAYVYGMARNIIFDHLKAQMKMEVAKREFAFQIRHENTTEKALIEKQYEELLNEAVERLPPQQQRVFRMAKIDGLSHENIAIKLSISRLTVKKHMREDLLTLRSRLQRYLASLTFLMAIVRLFE
ncbi:MAG: RNA polymerase sigma-70 factor [Cyclobacteriaceae bacterium]